ncbi:NAD(+) diphosphatase [bacterium]|nr:NAD(+) diphosphatase [bacterium]
MFGPPNPSGAAAIPLAGSDLDRAGHRRTDADWLKDAFASDRAMVMLMRGGDPLMSGSPGQSGPRDLLWLGAQAGAFAGDAPPLFLGVTPKGAPVFALDVAPDFSLGSTPLAGLGAFEGFRPAAGAMDSRDAGIAATARALFEWRRRHRFCPNCGQPTRLVDAGWKSRCDGCESDHFPRIDPVAIMLAVHEDACLLGRQKAWPPGFYSCLAGFIEPGETMEQGAARELLEEAGVAASGEAKYLFCQPWPFPSSLMVGMILKAENRELRIDETEIETARWFPREEMAEIMSGRHPECHAPPNLAIAHHIIRAWLAQTD